MVNDSAKPRHLQCILTRADIQDILYFKASTVVPHTIPPRPSTSTAGYTGVSTTGATTISGIATAPTASTPVSAATVQQTTTIATTQIGTIFISDAIELLAKIIMERYIYNVL